jgi:transcriptional regulator with XRE-family HTH domain
MQKSNVMNDFSTNVKALLAAENLTIQDLAERCGMRRSYLSRLIHGHHSPSLSCVEQIAQALGVHAFEIITPDFSKNLQTQH